MHVLNPNLHQLHEVSIDGQIVSTRDLADFGLGGPQSMVFAPSGDQTDDPFEMSLYIADSGQLSSGDGGVVEVSLLPAPTADDPDVYAELVNIVFTGPAYLANTIATNLFNPPSPDPSGIGYLNNSGTLLIADGEVNEIPNLFTGDNLFEISLDGTLIATTTTVDSAPAGFSVEPTGVSGINPLNNHIFISDDGDREITELDPGPDGFYGTADDSVAEFSTMDFSPSGTDPEGVAYAPALGELFIADGVNNEVYRVAPGNNGIFDGTPAGGGDDVVTHFDTEAAGLDDPEGIEYDSNDGTILVVGKPRRLIFQFSTTGTFLSTIDISAALSAGLDKPAGLAIAPSSQDPTEMSIYIVDRGVDNNADPNENDGRVFEMSGSQSPPVNQAPLINSGSDQTITLPGNATLDATVNDDGLPNPPANVTTTWSRTSGPGTVTFGNPAAVDTTASFSSDGTYVLRLTANDGQLSSFDELIVVVDPAGGGNQAPSVAAGSDQTITLPGNATLDATVNDDGLPNPPANVTTTWSRTSGPGTVTFGNPAAVDTTASFSSDGTYVLRLTANDGQLSSFDELIVVVDPAGGGNQAPSVAAGSDQTITLPGNATLDATVNDDGLPNPPANVTTTWSRTSGPGTVTFGNPAAIDTTASFSIDGTYVLRLTANDGQFSSFDELVVTVFPQGTGQHDDGSKGVGQQR